MEDFYGVGNPHLRVNKKNVFLGENTIESFLVYYEQ